MYTVELAIAHRSIIMLAKSLKTTKENEPTRQVDILLKPTELLNGIRSYMSVFQSLESYSKPYNLSDCVF